MNGAYEHDATSDRASFCTLNHFVRQNCGREAHQMDDQERQHNPGAATGIISLQPLIALRCGGIIEWMTIEVMGFLRSQPGPACRFFLMA